MRSRSAAGAGGTVAEPCASEAPRRDAWEGPAPASTATAPEGDRDARYFATTSAYVTNAINVSNISNSRRTAAPAGVKRAPAMRPYVAFSTSFAR